MGTLGFSEWLIQQAPVIVVMGVAIYWLAKAYQGERKRNRNLSDKVVELCTLWEHKAGQINEIESERSKQIIALLIEIKSLINR